jgi:hypothetical protein
MRRHQMWRSRSALRLGGLAAVAITGAVGVSPPATASSQSDRRLVRSAAATGAVYGGRTPQGWPVVIEFTKNQRRVVQAVIGLGLRCTSGSFISDWWRFTDLGVNTKRKFRGRFGPHTVRYDDGTTADFEGSTSGALNRARSRVSGRWRAKVTSYDSAGAVTDTCSASVSWAAKQ